MTILAKEVENERSPKIFKEFNQGCRTPLKIRIVMKLNISSIDRFKTISYLFLFYYEQYEEIQFEKDTNLTNTRYIFS